MYPPKTKIFFNLSKKTLTSSTWKLPVVFVFCSFYKYSQLQFFYPPTTKVFLIFKNIDFINMRFTHTCIYNIIITWYSRKFCHWLIFSSSPCITSIPAILVQTILWLIYGWFQMLTCLPKFAFTRRKLDVDMPENGREGFLRLGWVEN